MDEKLSWVYMTCGSLDEARKLGQVLLEKNLAACVNILDGMRSLYRWEGAVQEDQETVLIAKTRHELMDEFTETVLSNHSYECPVSSNCQLMEEIQNSFNGLFQKPKADQRIERIKNHRIRKHRCHFIKLQSLAETGLVRK